MTTAIIEPEKEEIEGVGQDEDTSWGDYPIDTLLIRTETRTVRDVLVRISQNRFIMDPDFQRDFIWKEDKQSKLVESVLMRIPLPVFYLAEDDLGRMVVVDGLQRLSTFQRFIGNELRLRLPDQTELNRKYFRELSPKLQNRLEDCQLILYIMDAKVPDRARLDIFERVNGGIPLTRQQMRNCLYMGNATAFLKAEAKTPLFINATGQSLRTDTMRDREFVNRFCAFQILPLGDYKDMDDFLAAGLRTMNTMPLDELLTMAVQLRATLENNVAIFGIHAFRKHAPGREQRSVINASLWDVMSTVLSKCAPDKVKSKAESIRTAFYSLMNDEKFIEAITYGVNDARKVTYRFTAAHALFDEVLK